MGKWLDRVIERKESKDKKSGDIPKNNTDNTDIIASLNHLTETDREYYFSLVEIMQSPKFGKDRQAAEAEAWKIVDEYRSRKKMRLELPSQQRGGRQSNNWKFLREER